jgi:large subunit ribosomal protein L17
MRHARKINHLGRTDTHRKAMLSNMAASLILHKRIATTVAKAKALRTYVEPLITRSKEDTTHSRRTVFSYLQDKKAVSELFREISAKIMERPGGYTRILRTGYRQGDAADMCIIELVDYNENMLATKDDKKKAATRRSRRGGAKKGGVVASAAAPASEKVGTNATVKAAAKVEDAVVVEETSVVEDATIVEEMLVVEDVAVVEETNVVEDVETSVAEVSEAEAPAEEETKE